MDFRNILSKKKKGNHPFFSAPQDKLNFNPRIIYTCSKIIVPVAQNITSDAEADVKLLDILRKRLFLNSVSLTRETDGGQAMTGYDIITTNLQRVSFLTSVTLEEFLPQLTEPDPHFHS